jgi:hypothetical protein
LEKARHLGALLERGLETLLTIVQGIEKKEIFHYLPEIGITIRDAPYSNRRTNHAYDHTGGAG